MAQEIKVDLKKDNILIGQDEENEDLYMVRSGSFLICITKGTEVIPLAVLGKGEYIGEMSFFDHGPRSANVIALEDSQVIRVPVSALNSHMPPWMQLLTKTMTRNIRYLDQLIQEKGIKRRGNSVIKPLSIEEQRHFYELIKAYHDRL